MTRRAGPGAWQSSRTAETRGTLLAVSLTTTLIGGAGREIATCSGRREAPKITEAAVGLIRRLDPARRDP